MDDSGRDDCLEGTSGNATRAQYPKRRLIVRSREVSKPRDWYFKSYRFEIWQAHRQQCCRSASQISERSDYSKYKSRGFETSRDLTIRRLFGYWDGAQAGSGLLHARRKFCCGAKFPLLPVNAHVNVAQCSDILSINFHFQSGMPGITFDGQLPRDDLRQGLLDKWAEIPAEHLQRLEASIRRVPLIIRIGGGDIRYFISHVWHNTYI